MDDFKKKGLKTKVGHAQNELSFIIKYWKVLFRADHPYIPAREDALPSSKLSVALGNVSTKINRRGEEDIYYQKIVGNISTLENLSWKNPACCSLLPGTDCMKEEIIKLW